MKSDEINCWGLGGGDTRVSFCHVCETLNIQLVKNKLPALPHLETTATTCLRKLLKLR